VSEQGDLVCDQILYQLEERAVEHAVIPWCEKHRLAVVAYSPFGHGSFPSSHSKGGPHSQADRRTVECDPRQVALQFLVRRPGLFAIPKPLLQNMPKRMLALLIVNCRKPTSSRSIRRFRSVRPRNNCPCFRPHQQTRYARIRARERRVQRAQKFYQSGSAAKNTSSDEFASGNERSIPSWASSAPITERSFPVPSWKYSWYRRDGCRPRK
jgi:hypothetical protein